MMSAGLKLKTFPDGALDCFFIDCAGAESVDVNADRFGMANGIGELHFALSRQAGRDDILRDPASHVSGAAIDFARVFSGERAAAVPAHAAIGIDDDFAAGQAGVALRAADHETAGRIDEKLRFLDQAFPPATLS